MDRFHVGLARIAFPSLLLLVSSCGGGGAGNFSSSNGRASQRDIRTSAACSTLSRYAFNGIPASYVDDGASLLYTLANDFSNLGRADIAVSIERVVDLTYQGVYGQLSAKSELVDLANSYC